MHAKYTPGRGVLIGRGSRWILLSDPHDDSVLEELWSALLAQPVSRDVTEESLPNTLEQALGATVLDLCYLDLSEHRPLTVTRGAGTAHLIAQTWQLSIGGATDSEVGPGRPLIGGVVAAAYARISPISATQTTNAGPELIDGVPQAILAAIGPTGPPPPRGRLAAADQSTHEDTQHAADTTDPALANRSEREEPLGHTVVRSPPTIQAEEISPQTYPDHDGATTHRPSHLTQSENEMVLAVCCPLGHLTPTTSATCRLCRQTIAPQEPMMAPRPTLGGLRLPDGEVVPLDRGVVLGRKPAPDSGSTDWPHLVHLPASHSFVSRRHLQIELDGWEVLARDLNSRGGTTITPPGGTSESMRPGEAYVLVPGTVLELAEIYAVRLEAGPGSHR